MLPQIFAVDPSTTGKGTVFKPAIPAFRWPQNYALDCMATGIG
jgi:hypothetical protein